MLTDVNEVAMIGGAALVLLALWRHGLRESAPRWVHVVAGLLLVEIFVGVIVTEYELRGAVAAVGTEEAGNQATLFAQHVSHAMWGNAIAVLGVFLAIVVLAIGTALRRLDDTPAAKLSRNTPRARRRAST